MTVLDAESEWILLPTHGDIELETFDGCCRIDEANPATAYANTFSMQNTQAANAEERLLFHFTAAQLAGLSKTVYPLLRWAASVTFGGASGAFKWKYELYPITEQFDWAGTGAGAPTWTGRPAVDTTNYWVFSGPVYPFAFTNNAPNWVLNDVFGVAVLDSAGHPAWSIGNTNWPGPVYGIEIRVTNVTGHAGGSYAITTSLTYGAAGSHLVV
ncbi:MAG TPA: hypothetical protein VMZ92_03235 [Planctomycetota bacterium]|nr:hypothetical protein [Planctomycetota bacterium]